MTKEKIIELLKDNLQYECYNGFGISEYSINTAEIHDKADTLHTLVEQEKIDLLKEFVEWYKSKVLEERIDTCRIQYFDSLERHETLNCCLLSSEQNALYRLQISLDQDLEKFLEERK